MFFNLIYVVLINGSSSNFFKSSRGLRQGSPFSPFLSTIMVIALNMAISLLQISMYTNMDSNLVENTKVCMPPQSYAKNTRAVGKLQNLVLIPVA
jgi:hypothetical protein